MTTQSLPKAGAAREALRQKGQFWTPDWVAQAMVAYVLGAGSDHVFDPAVGAGAFFTAAKAIAARLGRPVRLVGAEIYAEALDEARQSGLSDADLANVQITDFILNPPAGPFAAVVANPPYIRHHRLSASLKAHLRSLSTRLIGGPLDGRAGLHVYFLLGALERLSPNGRLAFIMPADTTEGVFAPTLWRWIARRFSLDAVVTFAPQASPFPGVDTNAVVFFLSNTPPTSEFPWVRCHQRGSALADWVLGPPDATPAGLTITQRAVSEALATGLSRSPAPSSAGTACLADFATVVRGIATGANEFFFLTAERALELGIASEFLVRAIGRTRDVTGDVVTLERLAQLEKEGRPTFLLSLDGSPAASFPPAIRDYLLQGEAAGFPSRALIASRRPWYKMETRPAPPFLFAYLGRRHARFVRNLAGVVPLTGFLCVYPRQQGQQHAARLWRALSHADTLANLPLVGKSYGGGAIKVEPRALERLPIPSHVITEAGLDAPPTQERLGLS